jgi:acetolactate synthase-1/3 small subunit
MKTMRHLISILLQNEAGALARVAGLFAARGYNIESLTVAATEDPESSRVSLVVFGDDGVVEQIIKQSRKLIDVLDVVELTRAGHVERELVVVRLRARADVGRWLREADARLLTTTADEVAAEFSGTTAAVDTFIHALGGIGTIIQLSRSGIAAVAAHPVIPAQAGTPCAAQDVLERL